MDKLPYEIKLDIILKSVEDEGIEVLTKLCQTNKEIKEICRQNKKKICDIVKSKLEKEKKILSKEFEKYNTEKMDLDEGLDDLNDRLYERENSLDIELDEDEREYISYDIEEVRNDIEIYQERLEDLNEKIGKIVDKIKKIMADIKRCDAF